VSEYTVYGLRLSGLPAGLPLPTTERRWPRVHVVNGAPAAEDSDGRLTTERAEIPLASGRRLVLDRAAREARFHGPPLPDDELVHPSLSPVATVWNRWLGRECFHAGAFVAGGRAWTVRGEREAGKSTLLAAVAARDVAVLADDIVVVDDCHALIGPRCIDLRAPIPGLAAIEERSRDGSRLRLRLPRAPASVPMGGWVFLEWGDEVSLERLDASDVLRKVAGGRAWSDLETDPASLLNLGTLPGWRLTRPRSWPALAGTVDQLLAACA
jgi:hypothetical protein